MKIDKAKMKALKAQEKKDQPEGKDAAAEEEGDDEDTDL
jgi:hypothetical protein